MTTMRPTMLDDHPLFDPIFESIDRYADRLVKLRRRMHMTPEASEQEYETTALVAEVLRDGGLEPRVMQDGLGVIADIDLGGDEGFVATRSELDCVLVSDDKQTTYASTRPGLCHACGHDAHSTMNIAVGLALHEHREGLRASGLRRNVRLVFQPAEETSTGARSMIKQGALNHVAQMIAVHVEPFLPVGRIGYRYGPMTAACKSFHVHVRGRGGHSARPHEAIDPIPAATSIVDGFYRLCPRSIDSRRPLALTVGALNTRTTAANAIPDETFIVGTLRTSRPEDTEAVQRRMQAVVNGAAVATGCDIALEFPYYCPATDNDPATTDVMAAVGRRTLGVDNVLELELPSLGGEDFAFYQELIPGTLIRLGAAMADGRPTRPLHSSLFDIDERAIPIGAKLLAGSAVMLATGAGAG